MDSDPNRFEVLEVTDPALQGIFFIRIGVSYINYELTQANSTEVFSIDIRRSCDDPYGIIPSILVDQEYTVTGASKPYQIEPFIVSPSGC